MKIWTYFWKDIRLKAPSVHFASVSCWVFVSLDMWSWQGFSSWSDHVKCRRNWSYFHLLGHRPTGNMKGLMPSLMVPAAVLSFTSSNLAQPVAECHADGGRNTIPWYDGNARATHWPWIRSAKLPFNFELYAILLYIVWYFSAMQRCLSIESSHPWDHWTLNQALLLSPLAVAMAVAKEGWLLKRGPSVESAWLPQWCVLASALRSWHSKHWHIAWKIRLQENCHDMARPFSSIFYNFLYFWFYELAVHQKPGEACFMGIPEGILQKELEAATFVHWTLKTEASFFYVNKSANDCKHFFLQGAGRNNAFKLSNPRSWTRMASHAFLIVWIPSSPRGVVFCCFMWENRNMFGE